MPRIVVAITHSYTWFWTQACLAALKRTLAEGAADGFGVEIVVVDNSWENSPSIYGVTKTRLGEGVRVVENKVLHSHSVAIDIAFKSSWPMDYFVPIDSDCIVMRPSWLTEFLSRLRPTDYGIGALHSELGVCCSFALYNAQAVKRMADASAANPDRHFRWGDGFALSEPIPDGHEEILKGPFSDRRGWPPGTVLRERPAGLTRGPGWYEPGQMFHFWALEAGYTYSICPSRTIRDDARGIPLGTFYGVDPALPMGYNECRDACWAVHFWGGTRAQDMVNLQGGSLTDPAIISNIGFWLEREAGWWMNQVPADVRAETLNLIREYGWVRKVRPDARPDSLTRMKAWYKAGGVDL